MLLRSRDERWRPVLTGCIASLLAAAASAQRADTPQQFLWTHSQIEEFLLTAEIVKTTTIEEGVTQSLRATLDNGTFRHDAQIQTVDRTKFSHLNRDGPELNFRDSYKYNIAAYRLSRLLGLNMVPVSVERTINGQPGALTWWIDDVLMTEKTRYLENIRPPDLTRWNRQIHCVRVFDELIYNTDRHLGNLIITREWKVWMIDHTRAFRRHHTLRTPQNLIKCDRQLLKALRTLDSERIRLTLTPHLEDEEIRALLARRTQIVNLFDQKITQKGQNKVLFDFLGL